MAEHLSVEQDVAGSSPVSHPKPPILSAVFFIGLSQIPVRDFCNGTEFSAACICETARQISHYECVELKSPFMIGKIFFRLVFMKRRDKSRITNV